jgi:hypothetical protein
VDKKKKKKRPNKKQIRDLYAFYYTLDQDRELVTQEAFAENKELLDLFKTTVPWAALYSRPHVEIAVTFLKMIDLLDPLIDAAKSEDKEQAIISLLNNLMDDDLDETYERLERFTQDEKGICLALFFATMKNVDALAAFGKTMDQLVAEASFDNEALFDAVLIDRTVTSHPIIAKKISMAEMIDDKGFMTDLANSVSRQRTRRRQHLDESRIMIELINDVFGLDSFTYEQIAETLVDDLQIFPDTGKDPVDAVKKNIQKRNKIRGK